MTATIDIGIRGGHRVRSRVELGAALTAVCLSLGDLAHAGITDHDLAGVERTADGIRRLLVDLRMGGYPDAA